MFEFIFCGTQKQYDFFLSVVKERLPHVKIENEPPNAVNDRVCRFEEDHQNCFLVGMVLAACYSAFENKF